MNFFLKRLKEPSTWSGIAALGAIFGVRPEIIPAVADAAVALVTAGTVPTPGTVIAAVAAVCAAAAVVVPEHKPALLVVKGSE